MKATISKLEALHGLTCQLLASELMRYKDGGDLFGEPLPASLLGQIVKFLANNSISAEMESNPALQSIMDALPFTNVDGTDEPYSH